MSVLERMVRIQEERKTFESAMTEFKRLGELKEQESYNEWLLKREAELPLALIRRSMALKNLETLGVLGIIKEVTRHDLAEKVGSRENLRYLLPTRAEIEESFRNPWRVSISSPEMSREGFWNDDVDISCVKMADEFRPNLSGNRSYGFEAVGFRYNPRERYLIVKGKNREFDGGLGLVEVSIIEELEEAAARAFTDPLRFRSQSFSPYIDVFASDY